MQEFIANYLTEHFIGRVPSIPKIHLLNIYNLYHDNMHDEVDDSIVLLYYGIYHSVHEDNANMIRCYQKSAQHGNTTAMNKLACYYGSIEDSENAVQCWAMAFEHYDYHKVDVSIYYCRTRGLMSHLILLFNKLLNGQFDFKIVKTLMLYPTTYDIVNILVNIGPCYTSNADILGLFT